MDDKPEGVAVGKTGVYVASEEAGTVTRIDPETGRVSGRPLAVGDRPHALALDGRSLFVAKADGTLVRVDVE